MAPPTQPVNTDGLRVIYQFEKGMMSRIPQTEEHLNKWKLIFQSARQKGEENCIAQVKRFLFVLCTPGDSKSDGAGVGVDGDGKCWSRAG